MALKLEEIRALAERVAASHALDVVDLEYLGGGGKHRTLRVFIEKNADERAKLRERLLRVQGAGQEEARDDAGAVAEARNEDAGDDPEAGLSEEDEALLEGLPSVLNMELLSGITHEDCENFSRDFGTVLDVEELVPGTEYLLEVSSPGLDRRLRGEEEYQRFAGSLAKLQTFEPVEGSRHWQGRLGALRAGRLVLDIERGDKGGRKAGKGKKGGTAEAPVSVEIALSNIEKAQLVPDFREYRKRSRSRPTAVGALENEQRNEEVEGNYGKPAIPEH